MTDERWTTAAALPGAPAGWRATLRDLLRHLRTASPDRASTLEWLRESAAADDVDIDVDADGDGGADVEADPDAADVQLDFLESAGLVAVDDADGRVRPGPHGREFLDTHDEGVLYAALSGAVGGLGTLLESLAVRPLTDVELRDLLEHEYGVDVSEAAVRTHRQWLAALGYVESDDGVTELTRAGRRRVETDDDLSPPRMTHPGEQSARGGAPAADGPSTSAGEAVPDGPPVSEPELEPELEPESGPEPESGSKPDGEPESTDGAFASLRRRYDHACMVCGDRRRRSREEGYALVHHPMPTDDAHGGPAAPANAVVVCPNHRADLRFGLVRIDPRTHEIEHAYEDGVSGRTLATADGHDLGAQYLAYHNEVVADF